MNNSNDAVSVIGADSRLTVDGSSEGILDLSILNDDATISSALQRALIWQSIAEANNLQDNAYQLQKAQAGCVSSAILKMAQGCWLEHEKAVMEAMLKDEDMHRMLSKAGLVGLDVIPFSKMPHQCKEVFGGKIRTRFDAEAKDHCEVYTVNNFNKDFDSKAKGSNYLNAMSTIGKAMDAGVNLIARTKDSVTLKYSTRQTVEAARKSIIEAKEEEVREQNLLEMKQEKDAKQATYLLTPEGQLHTRKSGVVDRFNALINHIDSAESFDKLDTLDSLFDKLENSLININLLTTIEATRIKDKIANIAAEEAALPTIDVVEEVEADDDAKLQQQIDALQAKLGS